MNIIEKYDRSFLYVGVIFNLILAWQFYQLWAHPKEHQVSYIISMATLMGFEFIMVHSGVFMAVFPRKWSLLIFFPFYGLFALAFAATMEDGYIILITYLATVFNRMRFAFADVPSHIKARSIFTSVLAALAYFVLVFVVAFGAKFIPTLGLTTDFLEQSGYLDSIETGGIFLDLPQTAMCLGTVYYGTLALIEFFLAGRSFSNFQDLFGKNINLRKSTFVKGRKQ